MPVPATMTTEVASAGKALVMEIPDPTAARGHRIELELSAGRSYRAIAGDAARASRLVNQIVETADAALVPHDGGLIANLKAWENMVLPLAYHGRLVLPASEQRARILFGELGLGEGDFEKICLTLPDHLSPFERRMVGFARAVLWEPELLVYLSLFDGLSSGEMAKALKFDRVFHRLCPMRTSLFVDATHSAFPDLPVDSVFNLQV